MESIIDIIEKIVDTQMNMDAGGVKFPAFVYGEKAYANQKDNVDLTYNVVYLYEPIFSDGLINKGARYSETYPVMMFFAGAGSLDDIPTDREAIVTEARLMARRFVALLLRYEEAATSYRLVKEVTNIKMTNTYNEYDINVHGVILEMSVELLDRTDSTCGTLNTTPK